MYIGIVYKKQIILVLKNKIIGTKLEKILKILGFYNKNSYKKQKKIKKNIKVDDIDDIDDDIELVNNIDTPILEHNDIKTISDMKSNISEILDDNISFASGLSMDTNKH